MTRYFCSLMKRFPIALACAAFMLISNSKASFAQPTESLRLMTYNILSYRTTNGSCTGNNNNPTNKDGYIRSIVQYVDPDIIVMNELGAQPVNADRLLTNALNVGGVNKWEQADYSSNGFQNLVNMLFYDSTKVGLHSQEYIDRDLQNGSLVRAIDLYRLYYKDPLLGMGGDTLYFVVVAMHLKAGQSSSDENDRDDATAALIDHLKTQVGDEHVFICGDYNTYTSSEGAIQNLVTAAPLNERFFDPVNTLGAWNNSPLYAAVHTQSTRNSGNTNNGCFAGGGMDDRFDMILVSDALINDPSSDIQYTPNSYEILGNDGNHFNKGIKDAPTNSSAPSVIIDALNDNSDHLPVIVEFDVKKQSIGTIEASPVKQLKIISNEDQLEIEFKASGSSTAQVEILDLLGRRILDKTIALNSNGSFRLNSSFQVQSGIYMVRISNGGWSHTERFVKR